MDDEYRGFHVGQRVVVVSEDTLFPTRVAIGWKRERVAIYKGKSKTPHRYDTVVTPTATLSIAVVNMAATVIELQPLRSAAPIRIEFDVPLQPEGTAEAGFYRRLWVRADEIAPLSAPMGDWSDDAYLKAVDELDPVTREQMMFGKWFPPTPDEQISARLKKLLEKPDGR